MNRLVISLVSLTLCGFVAMVQAATTKKCNTSGSARVVQSLYDNFPFSGRRAIQVEPEATLRKYFDEKLTKLFLENQACEERQHGEECRLSADVLYYSQDADITELKICSASPESDTVEVRFKNIGIAQQVKYKLTKLSGGWKISNIIYEDGASLVKILSSN